MSGFKLTANMEIDFDKSGGLVPAIIQDANTKNVLMLGYMNREAYAKTVCDKDTLLVKAIPEGPICHLGTDTCWGESNATSPLCFLGSLQDFIEKRHEELPEGSYTTSLFKDGINRMAQKVGEEALEAVIEAVNGTNERLIYEGADLLYHLIVLLTSKGLRIEDLAEELQVRHSPQWQKH